jgi:hypothetical protein
VAPRIAINVVFGHALGDGPVRTVVWEGRSREAPRSLIYSGIGKAESLRAAELRRLRPWTTPWRSFSRRFVYDRRQLADNQSLQVERGFPYCLRTCKVGA